MEEQDPTQTSLEVEEVVEREQEQQGKISEEENVVRFLDSVDSYLTLLDSLSSTLRQGWLELASARHSMGTARINGAVLDLKFHSAATTLRVTPHDADHILTQPHFKLKKWASSENGTGEENFWEDNLQMNSNGPQLRHRSQFSGTPETTPSTKGGALIVDDQVQKELSKSLSIFGTLVSPKLRAAQLSFETALETLIEIANVRSTMLLLVIKPRKNWKAARDEKRWYNPPPGLSHNATDIFDNELQYQSEGVSEPTWVLPFLPLLKCLTKKCQ